MPAEKDITGYGRKMGRDAGLNENGMMMSVHRLEGERMVQGSIAARTINPSNTESICDALLAPMPGDITFPINLKNLEGGISVSDEEVKKTIIFLSEHLKIVVEPGGAVAVAALLNKKINVKNKKIVVMISGGNIDLDLFSSL